MKQQTIRTSFELSGKGLHTGLMIRAVFKPAAEDTGLLIRRVDLPGQPAYRALAQYVSATERGTVLSAGEWKVSTIEHALSALYALGITNCEIELDAPEMPILDGSAKPFVDAILQAAGIQEQEAEAPELVIDRTIDYQAASGSTYRLEPADEPQFEVEIAFPGKLLHDQLAELNHLSDYAAEVSYARTFCFVRELTYLLSRGLIKGGDLDNALVIYEQPIPQDQMNLLTDMLGQPRQNASKLGYLSPLHFENEPARHKLLDLIGDFALLGCRIRGKVRACKPGHSGNTECIKKLTEMYSV